MYPTEKSCKNVVHQIGPKEQKYIVVFASKQFQIESTSNEFVCQNNGHETTLLIIWHFN